MTDPLIIFDCDGVLVDSEPISIGLLISYMAARNVRLTEAQAYRAFLGKPVADAHLHVEALFGERCDAVDLVAFQVDILRAFREKLKPIDGIKAALDAISGPICVASSSNMARISGSLRMTGLADHFAQHFFSTDQVERGKPHPDVFLHAALAMKADPGKAIVVEDSPAGLKAAQAAGMKTIAFVGGSHARPANLRAHLEPLAPDILIENMSELANAIATLRKA